MLDQKDNNSASSIIGIVLIFIILIGYSLYTQPTPEQLQKTRETRDSIAQVQSEAERRAQRHVTEQGGATSSATGEGGVEADLNNQATDSLKLVEREKKYGTYATATTGEEKIYVMENELLKVTVSSLGGRVSAVELKGFRTYDSLPLYLFTVDSSLFSLNFFAMFV